MYLKKKSLIEVCLILDLTTMVVYKLLELILKLKASLLVMVNLIWKLFTAYR